MSVKAILTNRELKNKVTGIDLYVSDFQEVPHRLKNTYLYHVIVVTNLFYYKSREHRESDVVQFMVSKSFEEFEELYDKLYKRFPSVNFPSLPGKSLLSNNTAERLQCMDKVLKLVANTQKLCSSPMLISFLKGNLTQTKKMEVKQTEQNKQDVCTGSETHVEEAEDEGLFATKHNTEEDADDLFNGNVNGVENTTKKSIFDVEETSPEVDGELFHSNPVKSEFEKKYDFDDDDDDDDLLNVSEDMDDLLKLSQSSEKHSSIKVNRPKTKSRSSFSGTSVDFITQQDDGKDDMFKQARTQSTRKVRSDSSNISDVLFEKKPTSLFQEDDDGLFSSGAKTKVEEMGQDDILSYISQQETSSEDVSLGL